MIENSPYTCFSFCLTPYCLGAHKSTRIAKISILKLEGPLKKSNERRVYESVDGGNLSQKSTGGKINAAKVKKKVVD